MKIPIDPLMLVPAATAAYKLWTKTLTVTPHGYWRELIELNKQGEPMVLAVWHGEMFPLICLSHLADSHFVTFVSQSKDGEFIARILERFGHTTVRGSSSKGGVKALLKAKRIMQKENRIAILTIDGPRGPRHKAKDGVIFLAQLAGARIVPVRTVAERGKQFNSWDRFSLPYPFSRCSILVGAPMEVTKEKLEKDVMAKERARLEERMRELGNADKNSMP